MAMRSIGLCLADAENEFLTLTVAEAEAEARQRGYVLDTQFTPDDLSPQFQRVSRWLETDTPPVAILVMATRDRGFARLARQALAAGIHWFFLNRTSDDVEELRRVSPSATATEMSPDDLEAGRLQGQIARRLRPRGARLLHVLGGRRSLTSQERAQGFTEAIDGAGVALTSVEAGWSHDDVCAVVAPWIRTAARSRRAPELVVCQTDNIALGVIASLAEVATELADPSLTRIPVVGCDGTPRTGRRLVDDGRLAATVTISRPGATAVAWVDSILSGRERPPARVALPVSAYPPIESIRAVQ